MILTVYTFSVDKLCFIKYWFYVQIATEIERQQCISEQKEQMFE